MFKSRRGSAVSSRRGSAVSRLEPKASAAIVATVVAVAGVGGAMSAPGRDWYQALDKPEWQPPESAFGPVWIVLYLLAAASAITAWHATPTRGGERRRTFYLYGANAVLNAAWTGIFFRAHRPGLAAVDSGLLLLSVLLLIERTRRHSSSAALALVPYAAWTAFATALSGEIARLNS